MKLWSWRISRQALWCRGTSVFWKSWSKVRRESAMALSRGGWRATTTWPSPTGLPWSLGHLGLLMKIGCTHLKLNAAHGTLMSRLQLDLYLGSIWTASTARLALWTIGKSQFWQDGSAITPSRQFCRSCGASWPSRRTWSCLSRQRAAPSKHSLTHHTQSTPTLLQLPLVYFKIHYQIFQVFFTKYAFILC